VLQEALKVSWLPAKKMFINYTLNSKPTEKIILIPCNLE